MHNKAVGIEPLSNDEYVDALLSSVPVGRELINGPVEPTSTQSADGPPRTCATSQSPDATIRDTRS